MLKKKRISSILIFDIFDSIRFWRDSEESQYKFGILSNELYDCFCYFALVFIVRFFSKKKLVEILLFYLL